MAATVSSRVRSPRSDRIYYAISGIVLGVLLILAAYPILFVLSASFSSGSAVATGKVLLWLVEFSLEGYQAVFRNSNIVQSFGNTVLYTAVGTAVNATMVMIAAYPLSRRDLKGRGLLTFLFTFTMFFSGGMIPSYIQILRLGLMNNIGAMVLPGALSVYNMIVARTFIQSNIPYDLFEAASIDGCSDAKYFFSMVLPLSKAVIAVIALFSAVGHWNSYFSAMIYLNDRDKFPLQIILREILIMNNGCAFSRFSAAPF